MGLIPYIWAGAKNTKKKILKFWFGSKIFPKYKSSEKNKTVTPPTGAKGHTQRNTQ